MRELHNFRLILLIIIATIFRLMKKKDVVCLYGMDMDVSTFYKNDTCGLEIFGTTPFFLINDMDFPTGRIGRT